MPVVRYQVIMPQSTNLPRDVIVNTLHFNHTTEGATTSRASVCGALCDLYQSHYGSVTGKVTVKAYDIGPPPNFPTDTVTKGSNTWPANCPREIAMCLSFADNPAIPSQRGRIYLSPGAKIGGTAFSFNERPTSDMLAWVIAWASVTNNSLPDIGGVGIEHGVYSPSTGAFHQAQTYWVDDEWDTVRRRGLRPTTRQTSVREG